MEAVVAGDLKQVDYRPCTCLPSPEVCFERWVVYHPARIGEPDSLRTIPRVTVRGRLSNFIISWAVVRLCRVRLPESAGPWPAGVRIVPSPG